MARTSMPHLDDATFEHALAVLDRARPSPVEDRLFRVMNLAVWTAVTLTGVFFLMRRTGLVESGSLAGASMAWGIALVYVSIVPLFVANWRLVRKLRRAARQRRRLATSFKRVLTDQFRARRRERRVLHMATFTLNVAGLIVAAGAAAGVLLELASGEPVEPRLTLYTVAAVFGLSCMFLHFMARGRERLQVIAELRSALVASHDPSDEHQLTAEDYDEIARIERGQIAIDRRRSARGASERSFARTYAAKEHRAVRDAKHAMPPETLKRVQTFIDTLTRSPDEAVTAEMRGGVAYVRVPDTVLELGFTVDARAREIRLLSIEPASGDAAPLASIRSEQR